MYYLIRLFSKLSELTPFITDKIPNFKDIHGFDWKRINISMIQPLHNSTDDFYFNGIREDLN